MSIKRLFSALSVFVFAVLFAANAAGQGTTSRVTGTVTDNNGAAVAGATVTLTNPAVSSSLTATTDEGGRYTFDLIQPGTYTVSVEKEGFKRVISSNNAALVNLPLTVNIVLEVGDVSAVVNVESSGESVQTSTSGNVGSTIEQRTLESLPIVGLRGRNPLDLLNYQPGVVVGSNTGGGIHVNGSRDRAFNFTLDGIDINESTAGGSNFTPLRPNPDSVQEVQIITSNATAELGRSSGAQVSLVTRSGTNRYSGNVFEYYQTPRFIANEFENNLNNIPRRQFVQHIYGFSFGGPVPTFGFGEGSDFRTLKDKAFFFVNYQRLSAVETRPVRSITYTDSAKSGLLRYVIGGANTGTSNRYVPGRNAPAGTSPSNTTNPLGASVNADGSARFPACTGGPPPTNQPCIATYNAVTGSPITFDTNIMAILNSYPSPNNFTVGDGLNTAGFDSNAPQLEKQWDLVMRFDYNLNDENRFYFRYAEGAQNTLFDSVNGGTPAFPGFPSLVDTFRRPKNYAFNYRWSPSARFTNEAIFGVSRFRFSFFNPDPRPDVPYTFNNGVANVFGNVLGNAREARTFQFVDNVTLDFSPHVIKTGFNVRLGKQFDDRSSAGGTIEPQVSFAPNSNTFGGFGLPTAAVAGTASAPNGSAGINSTDLTFLQGAINNFIGRIGGLTQGFVVDANNPNTFAPGGTRWNWYAYYPEYDFYVQDTWRFRPNIILDLGLRYEIKLSPSSKDLPIRVANQPFTIGSTPTNTLKWVEGKLFPNDYNNFGPSVGIAWDPFSDGKTSIRANYRLGYDRFPSQTFANSIYQSAPGNTFAGTATGIEALGLLIRNGLPSLTPTQSPATLSQPAAFTTNSITVLDPDMRYAEVHQWFGGIQHDIGWGMVAEANYIGKRGTHLFGGYDSNQVNIRASDPRCPNETFLQAFNTLLSSATATSCLIDLIFTGNANDPTHAGSAAFRANTTLLATISGATSGNVAGAASFLSQRTCQTADVAAGRCTSTSQQLISRTLNNPYFFQRFPQYTGGVNVLDSNDNSTYHGLEVIVKRRLKSGVGFQVGYTWSKSMDTRSFDPTFTLVSRANNQSASSTPFDINDRNINWAWSDFDRRHVLNGTYVWEIPIGKDRKFASNIPTALDWVIGGWQLSGTYNWSSGRPFTVYAGIGTVSNVNQAFANCDDCPRDLGSLVEENGTNYWFSQEDRDRFSKPEPGELGNVGRNYFIGPRRFQTDMSLSKKFRFTETMSFDLRVDARNLTNTASFGLPTATFTSSTFGRIRDSVTSFSRRIQFSGKFNF